jgi:hypothetical protein
VVVSAGLALLVLAPGPAGADPAEPGRYRSEVTSIDPEVEGVTVRVAGGDSFLELSVERGTEVVVEGYDGEPYLRVLPDGSVQENELAPTTYLNRDRFGTTAPERADAEAEPRWVTVADDGTYAWHDHRSHWMLPDPPPSLEGGSGFVQDWEVPLSVDGEPVVVTGTLSREPAQSPLPWLALAVGVVVAGYALGRTRVAVAVPALTVVGGAVATFVGWHAVMSQPEAAQASPLPLPLVLGGVALGLAVLGAVLAALRRRVAADLAGLASAAALGGWVLLRFSVLTNPVLPTDLPAAADRAGTAVVLGLAVAAAVLGVQGGALAAGDPDEQQPGGDEVSPAASSG